MLEIVVVRLLAFVQSSEPLCGIDVLHSDLSPVKLRLFHTLDEVENNRRVTCVTNGGTASREARCLLYTDHTAFARAHLLTSPGATVLKDGVPSQIPTLVPQRRADGACQFLDGQDRCTIHAYSPFGCRMFSPVRPAATVRSMYFLCACLYCEIGAGMNEGARAC